MRVLQVDIVVPVRNEERDLAPSVRRLAGYQRDSFPFSARITVADNGSTDATWAIASRLARELPGVRAVRMELPGRSRVVRGPKREIISRGYNLLLRTLMGVRFSDAQCGFKAIRRDQARTLLPLTQDNGWFFDTELLVLAERAGLRIHEIPVDWIDDLDSRV